MENRFDRSRIIGKLDIWLAHWTHDPGKKSNRSYCQTMWQWGLIKVGGMDVDADICFIDYPTMTSDWYANRINAAESKSAAELALEVLRGLWGNGAERR